MDLAHRTVIRVVVRIERDESLVENPHLTHFAHFPKLSVIKTFPGAGTLSTNLDGSKHFIVFGRDPVAIGLNDAKKAVVHELKSPS